MCVCVCVCVCVYSVYFNIYIYFKNIYLHYTASANKSLARPERKQARKHVRVARDFNIETRAVTKFFFFPARQGAEGNSRHSDRNITLFPSWSG